MQPREKGVAILNRKEREGSHRWWWVTETRV